MSKKSKRNKSHRKHKHASCHAPPKYESKTAKYGAYVIAILLALALIASAVGMAGTP